MKAESDIETPYDAAVALAWWNHLASPTAPERTDRAALAQLRRCRTPEDLIAIPAYHELLAQTSKRDPEHVKRLAVVAGVLAHVRRDSSMRLPRALATPSRPGGEAVFHPARFRRLLQVDRPEELMVHGARLARFLNGALRVRDVAQDFYWWNEPVKRQWAMEYYQKPLNKKE